MHTHTHTRVIVFISHISQTNSYFETLCSNTDVANIFVNSSLMALFVKMLASFKTTNVKSRVCTILGLLVRHAAYISPKLSSTNVMAVLTTLLKDRNAKLRRRVVSALGELLFYVATQQLDGNPEVYVFPYLSSLLPSMCRMRPGKSAMRQSKP